MNGSSLNTSYIVQDYINDEEYIVLYAVICTALRINLCDYTALLRSVAEDYLR